MGDELPVLKTDGKSYSQLRPVRFEFVLFRTCRVFSALVKYNSVFYFIMLYSGSTGGRLLCWSACAALQTCLGKPPQCGLHSNM